MPISIVNPNIQEPVSNIVITSEDRVDQGINVATMVVSWTQAKGAVKYQVEWRKDDGSWIKLPITGNNSIEVPGIYAGNYQAKVSAVNASIFHLYRLIQLSLSSMASKVCHQL